MKFVFGIPTLNQYNRYLKDFLKKTVAICPNVGILILDNGNQDIEIPVNSNVTVLSVSKNLGVAESWNVLCNLTFGNPEYNGIFLINDDIYWGKTEKQIEDWYEKSAPWVITQAPFGWCNVLIRKSVFKRIGQFDTEFYPAYYEDDDYKYRAKLLNIKVVKDEFLTPAELHYGSSMLADPSIEKGYMANGRKYVYKWGGSPTYELFRTPYNR